jgi:hypothetical protein
MTSLLSTLRFTAEACWHAMSDAFRMLWFFGTSLSRVTARPLLDLAKQPATKAMLTVILLGPLAGGMFYVWAIIPIPFAYVFGIGPAFFSGLLFILWLRAQPLDRWPGPWETRFTAALLTVPGTFLFGLALLTIGAIAHRDGYRPADYSVMLEWDALLLLAHAAWGALVCGHFIGRRYRVRSLCLREERSKIGR